jgi:hypothetical protein
LNLIIKSDLQNTIFIENLQIFELDHQKWSSKYNLHKKSVIFWAWSSKVIFTIQFSYEICKRAKLEVDRRISISSGLSISCGFRVSWSFTQVVTIVVGRVGVPIMSSRISGMSSESNFAFFYFFGLSNNSGNVMGRVGVSIISIYVGMSVISIICISVSFGLRLCHNSDNSESYEQLKKTKIVSYLKKYNILNLKLRGKHCQCPKRKQTRRVLTKMFYPPQSKISISLEKGVETKLLPDSALGNFLCNSGYKTKSEKNLFFSMPLEIKLLPWGWSHGVPNMPRYLAKVQD